MADYQATIRWQRQADEAFSDNRYSRAHEWAFDGGVVVPASASPHIVPLPHSVAENETKRCVFSPYIQYEPATRWWQIPYFLKAMQEKNWASVFGSDIRS